MAPPALLEPLLRSQLTLPLLALPLLVLSWSGPYAGIAAMHGFVAACCVRLLFINRALAWYGVVLLGAQPVLQATRSSSFCQTGEELLLEIGLHALLWMLAGATMCHRIPQPAD